MFNFWYISGYGYGYLSPKVADIERLYGEESQKTKRSKFHIGKWASLSVIRRKAVQDKCYG
jgi:hypothetical protein